LADERGGSGDDGFGAGDAHGPEEEKGEFADGPLEPAPVVQELDEGDEEDDGWDDVDDEPLQLEGVRAKEESRPVGGVPEKACG
jgi:hypothetical protein